MLDTGKTSNDSDLIDLKQNLSISFAQDDISLNNLQLASIKEEVTEHSALVAFCNGKFLDQDIDSVRKS
jgi:hypothetical protein